MTASSSCVPLILAAGKGTRMLSPIPKVLHALLGQPMLGYVLDALGHAFNTDPFVVVGHCADSIEAAFPACRYIRQAEQLGTGHALQTALPVLMEAGVGKVLVINGDAPLVTPSDISAFMDQVKDADIAFGTIHLADPASYGRVVRRDGELQAIIEAKDYDTNRYGPVTGEVNAGIYYMDINAAAALAPRLVRANAGAELYITDLVGLGLEAGLVVRGIPCGSDVNLLGVNSRRELAVAEDMLSSRINAGLLDSGVAMHAPAMIRIGPAARIAPGCEIYGPCEIYGATEVDAGVVIESGCHIVNSRIHAGAMIRSFCHLEDAEVGPGAIVGPYARLRPGAELADHSHVGNFVELKKTRLGAGAKANHLAYLGDADIGPGVNIGAGTITCNYDGLHKHKTVIGGGAFIGSNSSLVAPVAIGVGALVGAGSVITKDVPDGDLAVARGVQKNLPRRKP